MSEPFIVISRVEISPETRKLYVAAVTECIEATRREQGCLAYEIHESLTQPCRFVSYESWETRADIDRNRLSPHVAAFLVTARACFAAPPVVEVVEPRSIDRL
ncbi:hypothetical protein ASE63_00680 [Bosea sp. Root381]|uniref:putative quinol monooxygenase n=1 Tax=Bosea sp. Root381 TaxID=1736524 RepID=UPI0006F51CB7|nr:putative quinol monooxygenase [Bosea sp. Root381]KRE17753.1 hypothetical protein ASE63_00680 [Bosea sp. Root381]